MHTIIRFVVDAESSENLIGVAIYAPDFRGIYKYESYSANP